MAATTLSGTPALLPIHHSSPIYRHRVLLILLVFLSASTAPSESWDDDFVFQRAKDPSSIRKSESDDPRWSVSTFQDTRALLTHHSMSSLSHLDGQLPQVRLQEWAEPGPSTLPRHTLAQTENWDDDFEDKSNSPARKLPPRPHHKSPRLPEIPEPENWDDDLEGNKFVSPRKDQAWDSSDDEDGIDFADQEEDKTVTARPRKSPLGKFSPPPPLPPLPHPLETVGETFPGSPTMSVFSIPSGRDSATYSSLAHLPLRGGSASVLAMLPRAPLRRKDVGAYEKSPVHLTTMFSSSSTGNSMLLPYPPHLSHPPRTPHPSNFLLPKPPIPPDPLFCHVSAPSRGGVSVRDLRALALVLLLEVHRPREMRHPALLLKLHPGLRVGFFDLRTRLTQHQIPR
ncbi:hypothetical protein BJV74DRAFT_246160 [Russula compacta]|nr:hypothetical protein BJV74DRAFT_246160 [Russula compacta]